jgi:hypothetical protein
LEVSASDGWSRLTSALHRLRRAVLMFTFTCQTSTSSHGRVTFPKPVIECPVANHSARSGHQVDRNQKPRLHMRRQECVGASLHHRLEMGGRGLSVETGGRSFVAESEAGRADACTGTSAFLHCLGKSTPRVQRPMARLQRTVGAGRTKTQISALSIPHLRPLDSALPLLLRIHIPQHGSEGYRCRRWP